MSQENLKIVRQGWDAWLRGDLPAVLRDCDPEVVWDTSHFPKWPESDYQGIEELQRFLEEWLDVWDEYEMRLEEVRAAPDGRVVSFFCHRGKGRGSGVPLELAMAQIITLRNGKITRFVNYSDREEALEAAGPSE